MPTRRAFLASAAGLAAAAASPAIEPFHRRGKAVLKLSLAAYSLRQYLTLKPGTKEALDLFGFLDYCASLGLPGAELTSYYFPSKSTPEYLNRLKRHAHLAGLDVSGGAIRNDFCQTPGPKLDADVQGMLDWCRRYALLGARAIRVFAGVVPKGEDESTAVRRCIETMQKACEQAGRYGVFLALENHGGITRRPERMLEIVKGVDSPWFGVNLDSGNFKDGPDPYADLAKIAPYAVNVQVKVDVYRNGNQHETTDMKRLVKVLRDGGYSGWVALEYEGKAEPYSAIPKAIDELRNAVAG